MAVRVTAMILKTQRIFSWSNPLINILCVIYLILASCSSGDKKEEISVKWENGKAVAILIPKSMTGESPAAILVSLRVHLPGNESPAILGHYEMLDDNYVSFVPVIPLTQGMKYEITFDGRLLGNVEITTPKTQDVPTVLAVYPSQDTLPVNLLKLHIHFSKRMQEGVALDHILLVKEERDTLRNVFLDMKNELWDSESHMLTQWLDPGRIKRDLQQNKEMGPQLEEGTKYKLVILHGWPGANGMALQKDFTQEFFTGKPDYTSPDINKWIIDLPPKPKDLDPLVIHLDESLDVILLENTIRITDSSNNIVAGKTATYKDGTLFHFMPDAAWVPGKYTLGVEGRLEDMAGNNMNRPFDNDLQSRANKEEKKIFTRSFTIK
jgi:hypothetical protein